jgi:Type I phosphodiesterase / nucleotide pyrophosphatase
MSKRLLSIVVSALLAIALAAPAALAKRGDGENNDGNQGDQGNQDNQGNQGDEGDQGHKGHKMDHVLLLSIDGMHALDYVNCVNGGTCPTLTALGKTGLNYLATSTSKPSDSFPGLTAIVSGGSPRTEGVFYDVAYDRSLDPPAETTGNGLVGAPGLCTPNTPPTGTSTEYEEGIDIDQSHLNGGAHSGDGGINSIKASRLPRDPANGCNPVFPWNFVRTNTIFGVIHAAGGYTAWADKHPAYGSVSGPSNNASNIDDFYGPEINSLSSNFESDNDIPVPFLNCSPELPDQLSVAAGDDYTGSFQNIQCYDSIKVQAILNEIDGKTHNASGQAPVPTLFGMNFQSVSVGQKLVYQDGNVAQGYSGTGGYMDAIGTPSASLGQEIAFVDNAIGLMVSELKKQHLLDSTLIVITAKHGQSPIDPSRVLRIDGDVKGVGKSPAHILDSLGLLPASEAPSGNQIGPTEDDVSLLWLNDSTKTAFAVSKLQSMSAPLPLGSNIAGIGEIFSGPAILPMFNAPGLPPNGDPRTPDIVITTDVGVIYTGHQAKVAEHGGFANDDTNVIMLLSNPRFAPRTVFSPVETTQVAPTILKALGLSLSKLQAVQIEHTQVLPSVDFPKDD